MVTVRVAVMEDADAIASLTAEVQQLHNEALPDIFKAPFHGLFLREKLATLLHDANSTVAVAESNGEVIGHVYGSSCSALKTISNGQANTCTFNKSVFARTSAVKALGERSLPLSKTKPWRPP
jgi:hypothetical protein